MKNSLIILAFLLISYTLHSQEFEVRSFSKDSKDISAIRFPRKDVNNQAAAIIKVRTNLIDLKYNCNSGFIGDPVEKDGDIWLYVSPRERRIKFMKEGFLALDYHIEPIVESSSVYILELINKFQAPIKEGASFGFVVIKSKPTGAQVKINGEPTWTVTPFQKPLKPGQYSFELTQSLYQPYKGNFVIVAGKTITEEISLVSNFGSLSVSTTPEQGASIYIDDKLEEQITPARFDQLPPGDYQLTIAKEFYETVSREFAVQKGDETALNIDLKSTFGEIEVTAPSSVEVWIDQQSVGTGSFNGRLLKGIHLIEAKALNHIDFSETITVEVGQTHQVNVNMIPITGILSIMTEPLEAEVTLDGINKGKTPLILENLIIGDHTIRLTKTGYGEVTKQISLQENQTIEINERLPTGMEVTINSTPSGAEVWIDGISKGVTPFIGTFSFGEHILKLTKREYREMNPTVIIDGIKKEFSFSLLKSISGSGGFIDSRDGRVYKWVEIGAQVWMAENLNYKTNGSWCFSDNKYTCLTYGRLYNWETALKACPSDWHLPSDKEWSQLVNFLGGENIAGGKMKGKDTGFWRYSKTAVTTNSSGFSVLPGGYRDLLGAYRLFTKRAYFWSASQNNATTAWTRYLIYRSESVVRNNRIKSCGFSVRCIRDN